jgi:sulfur carrier protein
LPKKITNGDETLKVLTTDGMGNDETVEIDAEEITGKELLETLKISAFSAVIEKNNVIVRESDVLKSSDKIKVLNMIHGG